MGLAKIVGLAFMVCLVLISCNSKNHTTLFVTPTILNPELVDLNSSMPVTQTEHEGNPYSVKDGTVSSVTPPRQTNSSAVNVSPDGSLVVAVNPDNDSITVLQASNLHVLAEIAVGNDPKTLAIDPDSKFAVVANHGSNTVSLINLHTYSEIAQYDAGFMPYGIVTDGRFIYVTEFGLSGVRIIDLESGTSLGRISVEAFPAGVALTGDVTHCFSGKVTAINLETTSISAVVSTGGNTNLSQFIALSPDGNKAYLPQTRSNATNVALLFDTTIFPVVNVVNLDEFEIAPRQRITLDTADEPVNMPFAVVLSPDGQTLYGANAGSDDVSVINLKTNQGIAHIDVGSNPRGIAITPDGSRVFVNNVLDATLSVIDTNTMRIIDTVVLAEIALDKTLLEGKRIFNSAQEPLLSADNWISCSTCHFDGNMDTRTWLGFPDGPRNTPALGGVAETLPMHWNGDLDELQDVEVTIRSIQNGDGLVSGKANDTLGMPHAGLSPELAALASYLASIPIPPSPYDIDRETIKDGRKVFVSSGCIDCHMPPLYTDRQSHDVGTGNSALEKNQHGGGTHFDTPSLRGIWMTAPYFHDGSATILNDVFETGTAHNVSNTLDGKQIQDLIAFIKAMPIQ